LPKIFLSILLITLGMLIGILVPLTLLGIFGSVENILNVDSSVLFVGEIFLPIPIIFYARRKGLKLTGLFRLKEKVSPRSIFTAIPFGIGLIILMDELDRIFQIFLPLPEKFAQMADFMKINDPLSALFIIGIIVILGPLVEEIIFRGFFQKVLEYRLKDVTKGVLYSALAFTIFHFNPWWAVQIYIIGFILGYIAWRTNSIWIPFLLHVMNNGTAVWFAHQTEASLSWYEFYGHVNPFVLIFSAGLLYFGARQFLKVTPVSPRNSEVWKGERIEEKSIDNLED